MSDQRHPQQLAQDGLNAATTIRLGEPRPPPLVLSQPSARVQLARQRLTDLYASVRLDAPTQQDTGIMSGPGNQGSANAAHLAGQAGTTGAFVALPRQLKQGRSGGLPQ